MGRNDGSLILDKNFLLPLTTNMNPRAATMCCTRLGCSTPTSCQWLTASRTRPRKQGTTTSQPEISEETSNFVNHQADSHSPGEEMERQLVATKRNSQAWPKQEQQTSDPHNTVQVLTITTILPLVTALEGTLKGETQRPVCFRVSDNNFGATALPHGVPAQCQILPPLVRQL